MNTTPTLILSLLQLRGRKCLVLDDQLGGIFNLIINSNTSSNPPVGPDGQRDMENSGSKFLRVSHFEIGLRSLDLVTDMLVLPSVFCTVVCRSMV